MPAGKFSSSLIFAAVAGLAAVPYLLVALPAFGLVRTFSIGAVLLVAAYIVVASPSLVRGLRSGALTLALGVGLYALAPGVVVLFASAILLGVVRSGLLYRAKIGRAFAIEAMLFPAGDERRSTIGGARRFRATASPSGGSFSWRALSFSSKERAPVPNRDRLKIPSSASGEKRRV